MSSLWPDITFDYRGASVLVTGGTSGLGEAIARAYRDAGADVLITGTRPAITAYAGDFAGFRYLPLDVEDNAAVDALADSIERIDILINNAGMAFFNVGLDERDPDIFERVLRVHLSSGYRLAHRCVDKLTKSRLPGGGSIVGLASTASIFGYGSVPGYGAAKTGVGGLIRSLAAGLGPRNIRCNAVAVGFTRTKMTGVVFEDGSTANQMLSRTPLGRHGHPNDVAGAILFLTSAAASWISGQTLVVDGGYTISG